MGELATLAAPRVSIVGTRNSTAYGERVTRSLTTALVRAGACVISGMARGIDGIAHRSALDAGGRTVAVLGTGIDVPYPAGHRHLHRVIAERGLVLSENPPGATAKKGAFPRRNRIIAALAPVTIVIEAGHRSGALNTAGQALDLGRVVAAVPGPIDSEQSAGSNELLRDGAVMIASSDDALLLLGLRTVKSFAKPDLNEPDLTLWNSLGEGPSDMDGLAERTSLSVSQCLAAISSLEIRGLVQCSPMGMISRI